MQDLITEVIGQFKPWLILALILVGVLVWYGVHLNAEPGKQVSLFWGMIQYTKAKLPSEPKSRLEQQPRSQPEVQSTRGEKTSSGI